jgi:hypothetical protein
MDAGRLEGTSPRPRGDHRDCNQAEALDAGSRVMSAHEIMEEDALFRWTQKAYGENGDVRAIREIEFLWSTESTDALRNEILDFVTFVGSIGGDIVESLFRAAEDVHLQLLEKIAQLHSARSLYEVELIHFAIDRRVRWLNAITATGEQLQFAT